MLFDVFFPFSFQSTLKTTDSGYELSLPLPGVDPNNVSVQVGGETLVISIDKRKRKIDLSGYNIDTDRVQASLKHGMLVLNLPKHASSALRDVPFDLIR
jgi:HSP20 family molecular chaperone IbpA